MRISFLLALLLSACLAACQPPGMCGTEDGPANWTGLCVFGLAQGEGTATYDNSYLDRITGRFVNGAAKGEVEIIYDDGGSYRGGFSDGNPHGYGIDTTFWGEVYEGNWVNGSRHGEGIYEAPNGTRTSALWYHGNMIGAWYSDPETGCEIWFAVTNEPTGSARWQGKCTNGKAQGAGILRWQSDPDNDGTPSENGVVFEGNTKAGLLHGPGLWKQTTVYSNGTQRVEIEGSWVESKLSGPGDYRRTSKFNDSSGFTESEVTYVGGFLRGEFSGSGRRTQTVRNVDGSETILIEEGRFADHMLNGEGSSFNKTTKPDGAIVEEVARGRFQNRQFEGYGDRVLVHMAQGAAAATRSRMTFASHVRRGGTGIIEYDDGDTFDGRVDSSGGPVAGQCQFPSKNYTGPCRVKKFRIDRYSSETCLVSPNDTRTCLKSIRYMVS